MTPGHAASDLALAHGGSALALLLPPRFLPEIATVSRSRQLYWQAILLDLSLCRLVRSSRIVRGQIFPASGRHRLFMLRLPHAPESVLCHREHFNQVFNMVAVSPIQLEASFHIQDVQTD